MASWIYKPVEAVLCTLCNQVDGDACVVIFNLVYICKNENKKIMRKKMRKHKTNKNENEKKKKKRAGHRIS